MTGHERVYRALLRAYPGGFRAAYEQEMQLAFADLVRDRGARHTWARCAVDLAVTVPLYRLEVVMNGPHATRALVAITVLLGLAAVGLVMDGWAPAVVLLLVAVALVVAQRSRLARAMRAEGGDVRRRRLLAALGFGIVSAASIASWLYHISTYDTLGETTVVVHNVVGIPALIATLVFLVAGLATRRSPAGA